MTDVTEKQFCHFCQFCQLLPGKSSRANSEPATQNRNERCAAGTTSRSAVLGFDAADPVTSIRTGLATSHAATREPARWRSSEPVTFFARGALLRRE